MPLNRLRRILRSELVVQIDSSQNLIDRVQERVANRVHQLQNKGKEAPTFKPATGLTQFDGIQWRIRPVDLLHKLGRMTTPRGLGNLAKLSAGWATRRYFWAIAEGTNQNGRFRLSNDALELDFHQKGLLSDEFGVGMAGLFMEEHFGASESMDISLALRDELLAQQIEEAGDTQPDYLVWPSNGNPVYYLIECKGCQSGRGESANQLRRGLEQLPSIEFTDATKYGGSFVIATCLSSTETFLFLIDPPPSDDDKPKREFKGEEVSKRVGERRWKVTNLEAMEKRNRIAKAAQVLQWAGQNRRALAVRAQIEPSVEAVPALPDLPTETREIAGTAYRGARLPLFPEISRDLHVFLGVDQQMLAAAEQHAEIPFDLSGAAAERLQPIRRQTDSSESVSLDGTCMRIEGLPE